jgi:dephospho-CoA kinase
LVGLTGAIAAGKSEALAAFARQGAATISSDAIVHELLGTAEVRDRLVERWGEQVAPGGEVDRGRVGAIVFDDADELRWLESTLHPLVSSRLLDWAKALPADCDVAVVEVPLLFETGMEVGFDATVTVVADDLVREDRADARGTGLVGERAGRQLSQSEKAALSDHVVTNQGSLEDLEGEISRLLSKLAALGPSQT